MPVANAITGTVQSLLQNTQGRDDKSLSEILSENQEFIVKE